MHRLLTVFTQRFRRMVGQTDGLPAAVRAAAAIVRLRTGIREEANAVLLPVPAGSATPPTVTPVEPEVAWVPPTWEEVVRDHSARVYRLAYRLTGNPHDAEDLTQDVFVRVFRSLHRFQPGTFEGWLHRITTNLFLDGARRRQKIRFDGLADGADERLPSSWPSPAEQLADADLDHDVAAALAALTPEFRAAVVLCDIEGLTYEEISDVLDVKIGTVRSRIHRGRAQLRAALAHRRPSGDRLHYLGVEAETGGGSGQDRRAVGLESARRG